MSDFVYLYSENLKPICRDAGLPFAESLGFTCNTIDKIDEYLGRPILVDIGGATNREIHNIIRSTNRNMVIRIVDNHDFNNGDKEKLLYEFIIKNNIKVVSPYDRRIFSFITPIVIPYHYEESESIPNINYTSRINKAIFTGAKDRAIYPLRGIYYDMLPCNNIELLGHPGYSGNSWSKGKLGQEYLTEISKYTHMILTTSYNQYELLKYVECAQMGNCPVGEIPNSLRSIMPTELLNEIEDKKLNPDLSISRALLIAKKYRHFIMKVRDKDIITKQYENLFLDY